MQESVIQTSIPVGQFLGGRQLQVLPLFFKEGWRWLVGGCQGQLLAQVLHVVIPNLLGLRLGQHLRLGQLLGIRVRHGSTLMDNFVHQGISKCGVVQFIVAPSTEAIEIDEDVLAELSLIPKGQIGYPGQGLGIIAIHVEDRSLYGFGQIRGVGSGSATIPRRGETHLVVDNQVQTTADLEVRHIRHVQALLINALPGEGRISVQDYVEHMLAKGLAVCNTEGSLAPRLLLGTRLAHGHGIGSLKWVAGYMKAEQDDKIGNQISKFGMCRLTSRCEGLRTMLKLRLLPSTCSCSETSVCDSVQV